MGSEVEGSVSDDGSLRTAGNALDSVPVDVKGVVVAKLRCNLCSSKATELSPLALLTDLNPCTLEWRLYYKRKLQDRIIAKVPRGRLCNWCAKTFFSLGWEDEFATISDYSKTITSTNKERHVQFLYARKAVIKHHLKNGSGTRARMSDADKKHVSDAATTLDTVNKETTRMSKPKMQFVTVDNWDEKLDGKFDSTKVKDENCFGKQEKGIWKKVGREGVYDGEHFDDTAVEERTRETDDSGPLGTLRMQHKRGKLRSLTDNREKTQKEAAVGGPLAVSSVQDILNLLGSVGHGKVAASGDGDGHESSSSSTSSSSSDSSDEHPADVAGGSTKQRLETMFSGQKRAAGGTSGSATGSGHGPGHSTRGKPANAGTAAGKSGSSKKSGSVAAKPSISGSAQVGQSHLSETPSHEAVNMDGRNKRLRESLEKSGKECVSEIPTLTKFFHDEETCVWDDPASREKTKKAATEIKKHATKLVANQKLGVKRFGNASASGQAAAEEAKKVLDENLEFLTVISIC